MSPPGQEDAYFSELPRSCRPGDAGPTRWVAAGRDQLVCVVTCESLALHQPASARFVGRPHLHVEQGYAAGGFYVRPDQGVAMKWGRLASIVHGGVGDLCRK